MQHGQIRPGVHDVRLLLRTGWPRLAQRQGRLVNAPHATPCNNDNAVKFPFVSSCSKSAPDKARTLDWDRARSLHGLTCGKKKKKEEGKSPIHPLIPPCGRLHSPLANHTIQPQHAQLGMEWKVPAAEGASSKRGRPKTARPHPNCRLIRFPSRPHESKPLPRGRPLLTTTCCENSRRDPAVKNSHGGLRSLQSPATKTLITALIHV